MSRRNWSNLAIAVNAALAIVWLAASAAAPTAFGTIAAIALGACHGAVAYQATVIADLRRAVGDDRD